MWTLCVHCKRVYEVRQAVTNMLLQYFVLTLISIIIYVSDRSNAFSKVCIESIVTTQHSLLLHHPLNTETGEITVDILSWQKKRERS